MRVVRLAETQKFTITDEPIPEITRDQVLLRIKAVGVCGSDLHRFRGYTFENDTNEGMVLGHEFAAIVDKVGDAVTHIKVGDRVVVFTMPEARAKVELFFE